jgi:hypothetical protein
MEPSGIGVQVGSVYPVKLHTRKLLLKMKRAEAKV